jgi:hypothetical protein
LEYHDSWLEALPGIQPQLVLQSFDEDNFVEEVVPEGVEVEEDWEKMIVVDFRTELRTELLLERRLLAFLIEPDVL